MWNKRREEEPPRPFIPPSPAPVAPKPIEAKKEVTPVSSTPIGRFEPENRVSAATVGKAVKIVGQIYSKEDLYVDGEIEGTVEALEHKLTIGPHGTVHAGIKAREVVALGNITGNVEASDKIEIHKEAKLVGDIRTARIIIEDGAYFKGSIDIVKPEPAKAPAKPAAAAAHAPAPAPAAAPSPAALPFGAPEVKR
jgi:cytoskeletal protein CcmA (bactofilin family)